jgi:hypothetical protein
MKIDSGNSGSSIQVLRNGSKIFVEKIIYNYTSRDLKSLDKQIAFGSKDLSDARIYPLPFLDITKESTTITCKMRYISGLSGHNLSGGLNYFNQSELCDILEKYLSILFSEVTHKTLNKSIFMDKFDQILLSNNDCEIEQYILNAKKLYMDELWDDNRQFPIGKCHGDLTFSNMFLVGDELYLIDFLQTFLESPLQDVAKLRQDFVYGWSARFGNGYTRNILEVFGLKINSILSIYREKYKVQSALFEALCLLRISPYISDDATKNWLIKALDRNIKENRL